MSRFLVAALLVIAPVSARAANEIIALKVSCERPASCAHYNGGELAFDVALTNRSTKSINFPRHFLEHGGVEFMIVANHGGKGFPSVHIDPPQNAPLVAMAPGQTFHVRTMIAADALEVFAGTPLDAFATFGVHITLTIDGKPQSIDASDTVTLSGPAQLLGPCTPVAASTRAQLERLLTASAEHASRSGLCYDGNGTQARATFRSACVMNGDIVLLRYRVTTTALHSGECSPYPACAQSSAESQEYETRLHYKNRVGKLPNVLPGFAAPIGRAPTPLSQEHNGDCFGKKPPFTETLTLP